jgi:hypothetical protein
MISKLAPRRVLLRERATAERDERHRKKPPSHGRAVRQGKGVAAHGPKNRVSVLTRYPPITELRRGCTPQGPARQAT